MIRFLSHSVLHSKSSRTPTSLKSQMTLSLQNRCDDLSTTFSQTHQVVMLTFVNFQLDGVQFRKGCVCIIVMGKIMKQRTNIKFCFELGKSATETHKGLKLRYGDDAMSRFRASEFFRGFKLKKSRPRTMINQVIDVQVELRKTFSN